LDKDTFIGEYIGEISQISQGQTLSTIDELRSLVMDYTERNYIFTINTRYSLDAFSLGNETRFLNDSDDFNCVARELLVNGEKRIGIWTLGKKIKAGTELTISYGEQYWRDKIKN